MVRPAVINLNPVKLKYYSCTISLDKFRGHCNVLSSKICVQKDTKDINVKAFNMITNKNEAKQWQNIFMWFKCKLNSTTCNLNQKYNNKIC